MTASDHPELASIIWAHNRGTVDEILRCVEEGTYCALLGPRFSGKTAILGHVRQVLESGSQVCIQVDLFDIQAPTQAGFFAALAGAIGDQVAQHAGRPLPAADEEFSSPIFRDFLARCVDHLGCSLAVIFDHLEALPSDLNRAMLTSLRALHMEQQDRDLRFIAIVAGALSLAALTVGETSPFHGIARRLILGNLTEEQSRALVEKYSASTDVQVSPTARALLLETTRGNPHLIKIICGRSLDVASENPSRQVTAQTVNRVVREFLREDAPEYDMLQEAVRLIENDPELLQCILKLLRSESVPRRELPLPLLPDLDPLYLTGMVEKTGGDAYRIRNGLYRQFLSEHFDAARVGFLLTVSGRWDAAIGHLEDSIVLGTEPSRADLLAATINATYAAETEEQAAYYLIRGLSAGFQARQISIWLLARDGKTLNFLDQKGVTADGTLPVDIQEIPLDADRIEARSFRQVCVLREHTDEECTRYVMPLMVPGQSPVGVVTLCKPLEGDTPIEHRRHEFQLQSYLNQAARAIYEVGFRRSREARARVQDEQLEQKTRQLMLLHRISTLSQTISELEKVSHLILTAITAHFGLAFNRAWLFLIDRETKTLTGRMAIGSFTAEQAYRAWASPFSFDDYLARLAQGKVEAAEIDEPTRSLRLPISEHSHDLFSMAVFQHHSFHWAGTPGHWHSLPPEFRHTFEPGEMILMPLVVQNQCLGLIAVDNKFRPRPYTETDELLLKTFANQMATAIFNIQQHDQEKRRLSLEETLRDTSLIIGSSLDLKEVLHRILEEMHRVLPFDSASIQLVDEKTRSLQIIAETGFDDPEQVEALVFPLDEDYPNTRVFEKKGPLHFDDIQVHFEHFADPYYQATHVHGWLGAPLINNGRAIGVITLDSRTTGIYTSEHDRMAVLFAGQASVAIENATYFKAEKETKEYLDLLIASSQDGIIAVDNEGRVQRYSEGAQKILSYSTEEIKKKRVDELYGSLDVAREINRLLFESDRVRDFETTILDKEDNAIPIVLSASLLRDQKTGRPVGSVGFFKDLRQLRKVENNLRMLLDMVSTMSRVNHSEDGLAALAESIVAAKSVTFCTILLLDESKQNLVVRVAHPIPRPWSSGVRWRPIVGKRIPLRQPDLMNHLVNLPEARVFQQGQALEGADVVRNLQEFMFLDEEMRSALIVPMKAGREVFGLCILGETRSWKRSPFDDDKVELISSMVTQGAVFVDRLQAHEATQNKLMMVERLRSIGEELVTASPGSAKSILDKVVRAAHDVTGASSVIIYPWDKQLRAYDTDKIVHFGLAKQKTFGDKLRDEEGSMTGIVARKGMVIVDDIQRGQDRSGTTRIWTDEGGFLEREGVHAFVGIALKTAEDALGVLFVNFLEPHYFTEGELEAVNLFANQAAIAIENARLVEDLARRLEESETLQKVGILLAETRDLNLVLDRVMQAALDLIQADSGNILFYDRSRDQFLDEALMSLGKGQPLQLYRTRVRQGKGYSYQIITTNRAVHIDDTERNPNINPVTIEKARRAVLGVPLVGRDNPLGVLWVNWKAPRRISDDDEKLLMALASQAAVFIENVDLFDKLKTENARRNEESRSLQEVGVSLTETIDLKGVLHRVLRASLELTGGDEASILSYDEARDQFDTNALMCDGLDRPLTEYQTRVRQGEGLAYDIVKQRKPIFISDTLQDPRASKVAIQKGRRAVVGVPLLDYDGTVGVLWVNWKKTREVTSREANLLTALASQATVAIKGARRYAELQRRSAHLQAVHTAGKVISAGSVGQDRKQVLDRILEQAIECLTGVSGPKASVGTIQLLEEETNELVVKSVYPRYYPRQFIERFDHISLDPVRSPSGRIGVTGRAALTRKAQLVGDVSQNPDYIVHSEETRSELAIPMVDNGRVIGVMDVESKELNAFDELDKLSLGLLVDLAVVALRNAEQAEQLTRSNAVALMGAWGAEIVHVVNREIGYIRREVFLIRQQPDLPPDAIKGLEVIDHSADRLALPEIPERLPTADSAAAVSCEIDPTIRAAVDAFHSGHPAISLAFDAGCPGLRLAMHENFLYSMVRNLLRNAEHALASLSGEKVIRLRSRAEGPMAVFEIEDSGPGLRPEILPFLFKQMIPHEDGRKGRGLLLVGFIVQQHGGRIEVVQNGRSRGAFFRFWLPLAVSSQSSPRTG